MKLVLVLLVSSGVILIHAVQIPLNQEDDCSGASTEYDVTTELSINVTNLPVMDTSITGNKKDTILNVTKDKISAGITNNDKMLANLHSTGPVLYNYNISSDKVKSLKNTTFDKKFEPSPEIKNVYSTHRIVEHFQPTTNNFKPVVQDQEDDLIIKSNIQKESTWLDDAKKLKSLNKNYPKLSELLEKQHYQKYSDRFPVKEDDRGKWMWIPNMSSKPKNSFDKQSLPPITSSSYKNSNWHWNNENKKSNEQIGLQESDEVEGKIITQSNPIGHSGYTSYYDEYRRPQSYDTKITTYPYQFEMITEITPYSYNILKSHMSGETTENPAAINFGSLLNSKWTTERPITEITENAKEIPDDNKSLGKNQQLPWKKIIQVLSAVIPLGLLLSAMTPQVIRVNANSTGPTSSPPIGIQPARQRSLDAVESEESRRLSNPLIDLLNILQYENSNDESISNNCYNRNFCELSRKGQHDDADIIYKMLWRIANGTPNEHVHKSGLGYLFKAVRENNCSIFIC